MSLVIPHNLDPALEYTSGLLKGKVLKYSGFRRLENFPDDQVLKRVLICGEGEVFQKQCLEKTALDTFDIIHLAEGSFANVYCCQEGPCNKRIGHREPAWVSRACLMNSLIAETLNVGPKLYGWGWCERLLGPINVSGTSSFHLWMERLSPAILGEDFEPLMFDLLSKLNSVCFHNDLKIDNIMSLIGSGAPRLIDFDLSHPWKISVIASSTSIISFDFKPFFINLGLFCCEDFDALFDSQTEGDLLEIFEQHREALDEFLDGDDSPILKFRSFYDYSFLSLSLSGEHPCYPCVLQRYENPLEPFKVDYLP